MLPTEFFFTKAFAAIAVNKRALQWPMAGSVEEVGKQYN